MTFFPSSTQIGSPLPIVATQAKSSALAAVAVKVQSFCYCFVNTCTDTTNTDPAAPFCPARANPAMGREAPTSSEGPSYAAAVAADADAVAVADIRCPTSNQN